MRRIAAAVQHYEHGNRSLAPVPLRTAGGDDAEFVKLGKIDCDWAKGTTLTVQEYNGEGDILTGQEFEAINRFAEVNLGGATESWVACVLIGSTWHLIAAECHNPAPGS